VEGEEDGSAATVLVGGTLAILEPMPKVANYQTALARAYWGLGWLFQSSARMDKAEATYQKASSRRKRTDDPSARSRGEFPKRTRRYAHSSGTGAAVHEADA
jgi:hypothetical protein